MLPGAFMCQTYRSVARNSLEMHVYDSEGMGAAEAGSNDEAGDASQFCSFPAHSGSVQYIELSYLLTSSDDNKNCLWDWDDDFSCKEMFVGHEQDCTRLY